MAINIYKNSLRKSLIKKLDDLSPQEVLRQSQAVCSKILAWQPFKEAKSVAVYISMPKEVQTQSLIEAIFKDKKECFVPRFEMGGAEMEMVKINSLEDYNSLPQNKWQIRQPDPKEPRISVFDHGTLDLILVPGLGFTRYGLRIGRGRGYYDRFLSRANMELPKAPITAGLAFNEQILDILAVTPLDFTLDHVITELD